MDLVTAQKILDLGVEKGMVQPEVATTSPDPEKISSAEYILTVAQQQKDVADQVGAANVPALPTMLEFIALAEGEAQVAPAAPVAQAQAPAPQAAPAPAAQPVVEAPAEEAPTATYIDSEGTPRKDEIWEDASGNAWRVPDYDGGPEIEVVNVTTNEATSVPRSFLVNRLTVVEPRPQQEAPAEPEPDPVLPDLGPPPAPAAVQAPPAAVEPPQTPVPAPQSPVPAQPIEGATPPPSLLDETQQVQVLPVLDTTSPNYHPVPVDDHEDDEEYEQLLEVVTADFTPSHMPAPMDLESPPAEMPDDLTGISDVNARKLHSQFNALAARARYLRGLEDAKARACKMLANNYLKKARQDARASGQLPKGATLTEVDDLATQDPDVALWLERSGKHAERRESYDVFLKIYTENVSVLSRDWTMRAIEEHGS